MYFPIIDVLKENFIAKIPSIVTEWLDAHPEATTTVQDNSLTEAKFTEALRLKTLKDYVTPEMFGAVGDGTTDDTSAFVDAVNSNKLVYCANSYLITSKIQLKTGVDGYGKIIFANNGCFTISVGTRISNITVETSNKFLDISDSDITSTSSQNVNARAIFENINIVCKTGADVVICITSTTYGFFNIVFRSINFTGQCNTSVKLSSSSSVSTSWLNQIYFSDILFASPLHAVSAENCDQLTFDRCSTQKSSANANHVIYEFINCAHVTMLYCKDWDYDSNKKIYNYFNCSECCVIGSDRIVGNYGMTLKEFYSTFRVFQSTYKYSPQFYTTSSLLVNDDSLSSEQLFEETDVPYVMHPVHGAVSGDTITAIRVTHDQAGFYGKNSFDIGVTSTGKIKVRVRVYDTTQQDENGHYKTKWTDWYTFSPDT